MGYKSIAIDGPSGAGKSTLAKLLAEKLGFLYMDTGAIYRTVGLYAFQRGVDPTDEQAVTALLKDIGIEICHGEDGLQRMLLNGTDVTEEIRQNEISRYASGVSAIPEVRAFLLDIQRKLAQEHHIIMDGRDIGTVVLPQADLKIFLTADCEARARRRYEELLQRGQTVEFETVRSEMLQRDEKDEKRAAAPLCKAEDAILADTTGNSLEESFERLLEIVREHLTV
ncbi:MAG: cytidylate kinase [Oscillospiraceae bacterium]|nr:cytidylate kinase [Oscillospiraceae bacterium]